MHLITRFNWTKVAVIYEVDPLFSAVRPVIGGWVGWCLCCVLCPLQLEGALVSLVCVALIGESCAHSSGAPDVREP